MAEKRKAQSGADSSRRSRPAPTLDLTATEIPPEATPAEAPAVAETVEPAPPVEPPVEAPAPEPAAAEAPPPEPPPVDEPPPTTDLPPQPEPLPPRRERGVGVPLVAGFIGGLIPPAILAGLWYGGVLPGSRTPDLQPRFAQIEQQIAGVKSDLQAQQNQTKALAARVAVSPTRPPSVDPKAVDALGERVAKVEAAVKDLSAKPAPASSADPQLQNRIGAIESAVKSNDAALATLKQRIEQAAATSAQTQHQFEVTGTAVTQLSARVDDVAQQRAGVTPAQFETLQKQVAALEQATQAARKEIAQNTAAASASRLSLAAATLRNAVVSGAPYEAELKQAQALGADAKQVAPLQRFAASGVPSETKLAEQLRALLPGLAQSAAPAQASGSFIDRLRENAERLVRVTPANAPAGNDPSHVLTRLSFDAEHADIAAAMTDIQKLPPDTQQKAADWIGLVKARDETLAAAHSLARNAAQSLGTR